MRSDMDRYFPLTPLFTRYPWFGFVVLACVVLIWVCLDGYIGELPA